MNRVKYLLNIKYREKLQTEFSDEISYRVHEELDEWERLLHESLESNPHQNNDK